MPPRVYVRLDQGAIHGEALSAHQSCFLTLTHHLFKEHAIEAAGLKPPIAVLGESGMVGNSTGQPEATKPAVGQIEMYLPAQPPLRADAIGIAEQEHTQQQFGIDRRTTGVAVMLGQNRSHAIEMKYRVQLTQQVIRRNIIVQL